MMVLGGLLLALAVTFAAIMALLPLWRASAAYVPVSPAPADTALAALMAELQASRQAAVEAIREIDEDYAAGRLVEADYHTLRERYVLQAVAIMEAVDEHGKTS